MLHGMWDLPTPGHEPVSPALAGRFSTTAPPGKPWTEAFLKILLILWPCCFLSHLFVTACSSSFILSLFSFFFKIHLFIYFCLRWVFIAACGVSLVVVSGGYSSLRCVGFSLRWLLLLRSMGSSCAGFSSCGSWALEHRLSSCGAQA